MDKQNKVLEKIEKYCGDCEAWSGTDCTRNPIMQVCLKEMDKQKQIEEMADIIFNSRYKNDYISPLKGANELYNAGYRKIPEDSVVLTREEYEKDLAIERELGQRKASRTRKETAEKFAERVKEETDHGVSAIYDSTVDDICKELVEGK